MHSTRQYLLLIPWTNIKRDKSDYCMSAADVAAVAVVFVDDVLPLFTSFSKMHSSCRLLQNVNIAIIYVCIKLMLWCVD